jgi:type I restriction enzyme S subunit
MKLPKGWRRIPLHEIAEVRTGLAKGKTGQRDPVALPYLRVANVQDGHLDLTEIRKITVERDQIGRYTLQYGDLLMTEGGDFDKLGRGDVWQGQIEPCLHQNHVFAVRPQLDRVDPFYLAALAASHYGRTYFLGCAKRSTNLASINSSQLKSFPVLLPPLREQKCIARILTTWDEAVTTTEKLLTNSRNQKQALMQQLLTGKRRLPGYTSEWSHYRLGHLFKERIETNRGDLPLLSITREEGVIHRDGVGRKDTSNEDKSKYLRICPGDIGYNTMRMWQGVSALSDHEGIISPAYTVLVPSQLIEDRFAAYIFKFEPVVFLFYRYSQGLVSDTWNLKYPNFAEIKVTIPERKEQEAISTVLRAADEQINVLESKLTILVEEKRALIQQLLTGKRRVRLDQASEEESVA